MDKIVCKLCGEEVTNGHAWKQHRVKEADYFHEYHPRYSKETGELIRFKSRDFYLNSDFNDKREMMSWFKDNPEEAKSYAVELLKRRKERKNLIYAPAHIYLKLCKIPSIIWFEKNIGNYNKLCKKLGFKIRYTNKIQKSEISDLTTVIDSREQVPIHLSNEFPIIVQKLEYGDIALLHNLKISIERKSLNDLCGTISKGYDRFVKEIERAKKDGGYLIICIEENFNDFNSIQFLPHTKHIKASVEFLSKRIRDILTRFSCVQFVFCNGRIHMAKVIEFILKNEKKVKKLDLQLLIDKKLL